MSHTSKPKDRRSVSVLIDNATYMKLIEYAARSSQRCLRVVSLGESSGRLLSKALAETPMPPTVDEVVNEVTA